MNGVATLNQTSADDASTTGKNKTNDDVNMNGAIEHSMDNNTDATNDFDNGIINETTASTVADAGAGNHDNNDGDDKISNNNETDDVNDGNNNETNSSLIACDVNNASNDGDELFFARVNNNY